MTLRRFALLSAALLLVAATAFVSARLVPYDMDEFAAYHVLGCRAFPLSAKHNAFREACGEYDLTPPLLRRRLPLRSYIYIGSLPAVVFYPLWRVLDDPVAARVQGALFLLALVALGARLGGSSLPRALLALLVFPALPGAVLIDTGPVGISLVLLLSALVLLGLPDAGPTRRRALARSAAAGVFVFLGFWVKPVIAWCGPALALWAGRAPVRRTTPTWLRLAVFALALAIPSAALLLSRDTSGRHYLDVLRVANFSANPEAAGAVASQLVSDAASGRSLAVRVLTWPASPADHLPLLVAAVLLAAGLASRERRGRVLLWLAAAGLTFAATVWSGRANQQHHAAFTLVFVFLALTAALGPPPHARRLAAAAAVAVLALGVSLAWRWPQVEVHARSNHGRDRLLAWLRETGRDRRSVQLHASWGTYYIAHLFGDREQIVLFSRKFGRDAGLLRRARAIADEEKRSVVLISCEPERVDPPVVESVLGPPLAIHRFDNWTAVDYVPPVAGTPGR